MTTKAVLLCLYLSTAVLGPGSRAHPLLGSLDRFTYDNGRLRGMCSGHAVVGSFLRELEHAPGDLAEVLRRSPTAVPAGLGCFVRVSEEGDGRTGREGGRGEVEVCPGRVKGAGEGGEVAVVREISARRVGQVSVCVSVCCVRKILVGGTR